MKTLTHDEQQNLLENIFPEADRVEFCTDTKRWGVSIIYGPDENIDFYTYIPGTMKFRFAYRISVEV